MKNACRWISGCSGLVCMVLFLWIDWQNENGQTEIRVGYPDHWLRSYDSPLESGFSIQFFRWSVVLGVAGALALNWAFRAGRRSAK